MKKILFILTAVFHLGAFSLYAFDFGVVFSQKVEVDAPDLNFENAAFDISGVLIPRFSMLIGDMGSLYVSAAIGYESTEADPFAVLFELTRTDVNFNFGNINLNAGRMFYSDPLKIIADGLFDGAQVSFITRNGNIRAGAWYTGLLYRERAAITMTKKELESSSDKVDYNDFANTYFAPSRFLASVEYDHPSLAGIFDLKTSILAQFDLGDDKLNSQYLLAALSVPVKSFIIDVGACVELIEYNDKMTPAFAACVGLTYIMPTKLEKHLKLSFRYSSGVSDDESIGAFLPLTTVTQGEIPEAKFSGMSLISLDFMGRMTDALSASVAFTYFIRNDLGTYGYYPVTAGTGDGFLLGAELFARVVWNITTGIRLNFGTGVFMPALGDVAPEAEALWRIKLNMVFSIY
jgi:hypothetical protein